MNTAIGKLTSIIRLKIRLRNMQNENSMEAKESFGSLSHNAIRPSQQIILSEEEKRGFYNLRPVQQILNLLLKEINELKPAFDLQYTCRYPPVERVSELEPHEVPGLLERMTSHHILDSHFHEKIIVCNRCSSPNLAPRYLCPHCKSISISKHQTIEHVSCGYISIEDEFLRGNNNNTITNNNTNAICPRCKTGLRQNSPDVKINEGWFFCNDCSRRSREPVGIYYCRECERIMFVGDIAFKNLYSYTLSKSVDIDKVILIEPLREILEKMEYQTESPGYITGKSGIKHRFDLVCHKQNTTIVIDVRYSDVIVNESHLTKLFGAAFDAKVDRSIMIAIPEVTDATLSLAEQYGIMVIKGTEMKDVSTKLENVMRSSS